MTNNLITLTKRELRGSIVFYGQDGFWESDYNFDTRKSSSIDFYAQEKLMGTAVVILTMENLGDLF
jgi:hypothetical protein